MRGAWSARGGMGLLVCAAALGGAAAVADQAASGRTAAVAHTRALIYSPFTASGMPRVRTVFRRGSCFTGSLAANRRDAWRCFVGHFLYDPCFWSARHPRRVVCVRAPWYRTGVRVRLTESLPGRVGNRRRARVGPTPWAIRTADAAGCVLLTGTSTVVDGQRLNYGCGKGEDPLWGIPDRSSQPWTILTAPLDADQLTDRVATDTAWY